MHTRLNGRKKTTLKRTVPKMDNPKSPKHLCRSMIGVPLGTLLLRITTVARNVPISFENIFSNSLFIYIYTYIYIYIYIYISSFIISSHQVSSGIVLRITAFILLCVYTYVICIIIMYMCIYIFIHIHLHIIYIHLFPSWTSSYPQTPTTPQPSDPSRDKAPSPRGGAHCP